VLLAFKGKFRPLIKEGKKTQTLRLWKRCPFQPGAVVLSPKLGKVRINSVEKTLLSELSQDDAVQEGFEEIEQLVKSIKEIYSLKRIANVECFKIRFTYLGKKQTCKEPAEQRVTKEVGQVGRQLRLIRPF
jgi:hypothetical protein